jgi:hypothetical protein
MSVGRVFQEALRILLETPLPEVARDDVIAVLEANRSDLLQFFYDAAREAGTPSEPALRRSAGVFFWYASGQLADDLADGDCDYLDEPLRTGPSAAFLLAHLGYATLVQAGVDAAALGDAARELVCGTGPQHLEVRAKRWDAALFREVGSGIAGRQLAAYLRVLWSNSSLESRALEIGFDLGIAAHVAADVRSGDPRFHSLEAGDRLEILAWAQAAIARAHSHGLASIEAALRGFEPVFATHRSQDPAP